MIPAWGGPAITSRARVIVQVLLRPGSEQPPPSGDGNEVNFSVRVQSFVPFDRPVAVFLIRFKPDAESKVSRRSDRNEFRRLVWDDFGFGSHDFSAFSPLGLALVRQERRRDMLRDRVPVMGRFVHIGHGRQVGAIDSCAFDAVFAERRPIEAHPSLRFGRQAYREQGQVRVLGVRGDCRMNQIHRVQPLVGPCYPHVGHVVFDEAHGL